MNKTAILRFILDEVALKCRNVSKNMRKRIHWMLKYKEIILKKYDERALIFNGWIRVGQNGFNISAVEEMKKGVSNYCLRTQEQLDRVVTLNNEIRCNRLQFILTAPIEVESIENFTIDQDNYEVSSKCSFNTVKYLSLKNLSTEQIKFILTRCKRIEELRIRDCSLQSLNLTQSRIKQFYFESVSLKEPIYLPKQIEELDLTDCKSPNLIKAQRVNRINFSNHTDDPNEYVELTKTLKEVKVARIDYSLGQRLPSLPSTVREVDGSWDIEYNLEAIMNQFPNLIEFARKLPIEPTDKSKLRVIYPTLKETEEKFSLRPRKIRVDLFNTPQLNSHPELFEKVEWVIVKSN